MIIANIIHNYLFIFSDAYPIYWQFVHTDIIKDFIFFQTYNRASSKQVIIAIQLGTNKKNSLVKLKDKYNEHTTQKQK